MIEWFVCLARKLWSTQFLRFLLVGGINTLFGYSIYALFILLHIHYAIASLMSTIIGIFFNFFTTGRIVFANKDWELISKFFLVYGITYLANFSFYRYSINTMST